MKLKPLKKMGQPDVFRHFNMDGLTSCAHEVVFGVADIKSEGIVNRDMSGKSVYSGSTMLSIKLKDIFLSAKNDDDLNKSGALFVEHLKKSVGFRLGVMRLARKEAERKCSFMHLDTLETELGFKIANYSILIDIDVCGRIGITEDNLKSANEDGGGNG